MASRYLYAFGEDSASPIILGLCSLIIVNISVLLMNLNSGGDLVGLENILFLAS